MGGVDRMNKDGKKPELHLVDGREMTAVEIAEMLGISKAALRCRRSRMGGISYQAIVNMYRSNQLGSFHDRAARYLIEGEWLTQTQIAERLGVKPHTISAWRYDNGASMMEAVEHFRRWNEGGRVRNPVGGRPAREYRVGSRYYTIPGVARKFDVAEQTVRAYVYTHGMAEALKHYQGAERRRRDRAEREIMRILGY